MGTRLPQKMSCPRQPVWLSFGGAVLRLQSGRISSRWRETSMGCKSVVSQKHDLQYSLFSGSVVAYFLAALVALNIPWLTLSFLHEIPFPWVFLVLAFHVLKSAPFSTFPTLSRSFHSISQNMCYWNCNCLKNRGTLTVSINLNLH